jgi:outer membrane protein assembly factor BamB
MRPMKLIALCMAVLFISTSWVVAEDWPQWRGPHQNGSTVEADLPSEWSTTDNVAWAADLPGCSASTPIIAGGQIYLSCVDASTEKLLCLCLDQETGEILWRYELEGDVRRDGRSTFAAPSAVSDGEAVVFFFSNGELIRFRKDGMMQWKRNIQNDYGTFAFLWTFAASPMLYEGKVYVQVLQRDVPVDGRGFEDKPNESYILAIDYETGETVWRQVRPCEANAESKESFSTPVIAEINGSDQLLIIGGDDLTGHDPQTGKELWRWGTWNPERIGHWRLVPSPVAGDGIVLACGPKRAPIFAIQPGDDSGQLSDDAIAWLSAEVRDVTSDVPTPAFYDGDFFVLSDLQKKLMRVDAKTGEVKWMIDTPGRGKYEASPTAADGKIFIFNFDGDATVVDAASGDILNTVSMDEAENGEVCRATIVVAGRQLFIRTTRKLYCIGE